MTCRICGAICVCRAASADICCGCHKHRRRSGWSRAMTLEHEAGWKQLELEESRKKFELEHANQVEMFN